MMMTVLHWWVGRAAETADRQRCWCQRTRLRAVDSATRCRYLWTRETMQISLSTVSIIIITYRPIFTKNSDYIHPRYYAFIILPYVGRFSHSFTFGFSQKFAIKPLSYFQSHIKHFRLQQRSMTMNDLGRQFTAVSSVLCILWPNGWG